MDKTRIYFLNIPVDAMSAETFDTEIKKIFQAHNGQNHQIVFLTVKKLLRGRRDNEYFRCLKTSSFILPVSSGIIRGAKFQKKPQLYRYNPFELVIRLLSAADEMKQSVYLLGSKKEILEKAESNLKTSFPNLRFVGRYTGFYMQDFEQNILLSIKKTAPTVLLVGTGIKDRDKWILRHKDNFKPCILLSVDNCFEIFAGVHRNISKQLFKMGLESLSGMARRPWYVLRIFPFLYFKLLVLIYKIRHL